MKFPNFGLTITLNSSETSSHDIFEIFLGRKMVAFGAEKVTRSSTG